MNPHPTTEHAGQTDLESPEILAIVDDLTQILVEVIGEDFLLEVEVTPATTFSLDLGLESIEFVAVAEKLQQRYAGRVDFTAFLAGLSIDEILSLTVGELASHIRQSLDA
jgi:acyl carrier protein